MGHTIFKIHLNIFIFISLSLRTNLKECVMRVDVVNGTHITITGSITYPLPGWNTSSRYTPSDTFTVKAGEYMNPEEAFFGRGGCSDMYLLSSQMVEICVKEHAPYMDRERECAYRQAQKELSSEYDKTTWINYWELPLGLLQPFDQIRLISAASKLISRDFPFLPFENLE